MNTVIRFSISFLGAVMLPIFMLWLELTLTHGKGFRSTASNASWTFCVVVGLAAIALLPVQKQIRWFLGVVYLPVAYIVLLILGLYYACERFGNCM